MEDIEGNDVLDENGVLPWEECFFVKLNDSDKLQALNDLLKAGYYIYESYPLDEAVFVRLRSTNHE